MLSYLRPITLHGVRSKRLKPGRQFTSKKQTNTNNAENLNEAETTECEVIQAIVNQAAIQAMTAVMMVLRDVDAGL